MSSAQDKTELVKLELRVDIVLNSSLDMCINDSVCVFIGNFLQLVLHHPPIWQTPVAMTEFPIGLVGFSICLASDIVIYDATI